MIAVDLDDSLLGDDLKISEANKKAIFEASNEGIIVTIATGRMYKSALPYIEQLKLDVPVITYKRINKECPVSRSVISLSCTVGYCDGDCQKVFIG